ncbi:MAG TPA: efflux RND transporter periplasmic adaptor subunit [Methylococcaceae bacterium]|nr:efflux RND transporter periplasmic adaptor subunit [Methylococcaceae bacterium]
MPRFWLFVVAAVIALAGAFWLWRGPAPIAVSLHTIEYGEVEEVVANTRVGTVKACRRAFLAPSTGGRVAVLEAREGMRTEAGQLLLEVWNDDLKAQLALEIAEVAVAEAQLAENCTLARLASRAAERLLRMRDHKRVVSEEAVDDAVSQSEARAAACRRAQAGVTARGARVDAARAAVERTQMRAPFDGVVAEVNAELGEFVTPSPPGIPTLPPIDLLDVSCLYVSAPIDEVDAPAIRTGLPARVGLDAFAGRKFAGSVRRVAPYVLDKEKQARTVEVEVELDAREALGALLPGYSADIEILLQTRPRVLRVPSRAVLEGRKVLVLNAAGRLEEREFSPGLSNWDYTEVVDGLRAGERVVLSTGQEGVKADVRAVPAP